MIDNSKEYILCAAIRRKQPREGSPYWEGTNDIMNIEIGYRHHDIFHRFNNRDIHQNYEDCEVSILMEDQGFYTSKGRFVDRYEGMEIAFNAGQVSERIALHKSDIKLNATDENGNPVGEFIYKAKPKEQAVIVIPSGESGSGFSVCGIASALSIPRVSLSFGMR